MRIILILVVVLMIAIKTTAQPLYNAVIPGDTMKLVVTGYAGTIQWQQSTNNTVWTDMTGLTSNVAIFIVTTSPTNIMYYRAKVEALCPNTPWYSSVIQTFIETNTANVQVGARFRGGIVIYNNAGNGLIAPQQDQGAHIQWGCPGTNVWANSLTDGEANTMDILSMCYAPNIAAFICDTLRLNGYSDWFLPAKDQLDYLHQRIGNFEGFTTGFYWSSTQSDNNNAWCENLNIGDQMTLAKSNQANVRCVRSFSPTDIFKIMIDTVVVTNQPVTVSIATQPETQSKCFGESVTFEVVASGTASYSYQWKKDGVDILDSTNSSYSKSGLTSADDGVYTCEVTNLCRSILSNEAHLNMIQISANAGDDAQICPGYSTMLSASGSSNYSAISGSYTYSWSPTAELNVSNIYNPNASPTVTTDYTVTVTDQLGCTATDIATVFEQNPYSNENICLVSVDTITWKNKVMWEKTIDVGTAGYKILKEVSTNIYDSIGYVSFNDPGYFIDVNSNPESHSDRYKISVVDICGYESDSSMYHNTINLVISVFGNTMGLDWTQYQTEDGSYVPSLYYIYKGTTPETMQLLTTVTGNQNTYNDLNVFDLNYYMIGVQRNCNTNTAYSNFKSNGLVGVQQEYLTGTIQISPNPMSASATITIPNLQSSIRNPQSSNPQSTIRILDITGKVVRLISASEADNFQINSSSNLQIRIERGNLKPGVYFVELKADKFYRGKLIVE